MNAVNLIGAMLQNGAVEFLEAASWGSAACAPLAGDASTRRYYRLRKAGQSAVLMDASQSLGSVAPFLHIAQHLAQLGFSAPGIFAWDEKKGFMLLEDFGDATFVRLLEGNGHEQEKLYALATDVLIALHKSPQAIPERLREYDPPQMLSDVDLFLEWRTPAISDKGKAEFAEIWRTVLPLAHQVPGSLLLRDYHAANLMLLGERQGIRQAGLLDFQDAYQGPVTYDLMSLLEDARRDVPEGLREEMMARYLAQFPEIDRSVYRTSMAILAALRHMRVLAIFERLSRRDGKHDYKNLHSPRVARLLERALRHPKLSTLAQWVARYAR